jgi:transposase InsO family protein
VTRHPTAEWTGQQLRNAFPFGQLPGYLLRYRDAIYGQYFREQVRDMGIEEVLSTPRSPWQRAYVERVSGSIRRERLDHVIVFNESSLRRKAQIVFRVLPSVQNEPVATQRLAGASGPCNHRRWGR